jgi:uncharacterized membrane protein YraQ (UPF0718 family)
VNSATIILTAIALILFWAAWRRGDGSHKRGIELGAKTLKRTGALLFIAFMIVGYINVLSPTDLVRAWIGPDSDWIGLLVAEGVGLLLPGGPYVVFPIIAVLFEAGAGVGPAVTMITSWATQALLTVTFEIPFMGWRFIAIRWGLGLFVPLIAGTLAQILFSS